MEITIKVKVKVEIAIKEGSASEEGIAQKEEVIFQGILFKEEIVLQQSEVFKFVCNMAGGGMVIDKMICEDTGSLRGRGSARVGLCEGGSLRGWGSVKAGAGGLLLWTSTCEWRTSVSE